MSEHLRMASSSSSSPGRLPTISRPEWPWSARSYPHRTSQSSLNSNSSTAQASGLHSSWDPSMSAGSNPTANSPWRANTMSGNNVTSAMSFIPGESTRQWTFMGFEWSIRDVSKLRNYVEGVEDTESTAQDSLAIEQGDFEILKQSPMLGDNKFKLEIAHTPSGEANSISPGRQTLSLYITSVIMDFAHGDETSASMMAAIKCQDDRAGERGARPDWVWEFWQNDWVFRQESEVWECPLPSLSSLLENPRIRETDSFVICVQIHCPVGPTIPQYPSMYHVPKDLLDGIEASLDNPNTGDVQFICLERLSADASSPAEESNMPHTQRSTSPESSYSMFSRTTARKRVIYAHSDILSRRSEYFSTMLSSAFAESSGPVTGERKLHSIIVEEADFETIYWLLKYCYANWLLFKEVDDPKAAVEGVGAGWSAKWLHGRQGEWDWKFFHKAGPYEDNTDTRSAASGDSIPPSGSVSRTTGGHQPVASTVMSVSTRSNPSKSSLAASRQSTVPASSPSSRQPAASTSNVPMIAVASSSGSSAPPRSKSIAIPMPSGGYQQSSHYPSSSHSARQTASADPHPHPTPAPPPASALSMYQVAHRYAMPTLAALSLEHMMSTITPQSSFSLLLATSVWDELHSIVEGYVIDKWDEVSISDEFEQCCQEVAAGEWGSDGGKTLMAVFRRLRSPTITT
ncbi:hypothetical protein BDQ12DRAFT_702699 [Crucibulum laeve]|uniref:BTB domain-containing protein n=1 Tax=Crucibulum laeve TaxID=68775 RepID=A0A5C3MQZ0_9AGAR|nr:hypothetical protein BDQ12DRAFT_702699 [Crucibulum laeve]